MCGVPPARVWWPAVDAPLERGVRPQYGSISVFLRICTDFQPTGISQVARRARVNEIKHPAHQADSSGLGLTMCRPQREVRRACHATALSRLKGAATWRMNGSPAVAIAAAIETPYAKNSTTNALTSEAGNAPFAHLVPRYPITATATMCNGNTQISAALASVNQAPAPSGRHAARNTDAMTWLA